MNPYIYIGLSKTDQHRFVSFRTETSHEMILRHVTSVFKVSQDDLTGKERTREFVVPRQIAQYLMKERTQMTLVDIGKLFNRDHSTVIYSIRTVNDLIETDKEFIDKYEQIQRKITEKD